MKCKKCGEQIRPKHSSNGMCIDCGQGGNKELKRKGNCSKCGECCKHAVVTVPKKDANISLATYKGIKIVKHNDVDKISFIFPARCKYLRTNNLCAINDRKPIECKRYPYTKEQTEHFETCTFYFE